jgi:hypothetical protein
MAVRPEQRATVELSQARTVTVTLTFDKGVNKDLLASELPPGYVSDCLNFRFRNGFAEKYAGYFNIPGSVGSGSAISISSNGFVFPIQGSGSPYAVIGNGSLAWAVGGSTFASYVSYEITRYAKPQTISSLTRIGANTAQVTTASAHGLSTSDVITLFGATEAGYNVTQVAITKISATVFQYTTVTAIAGNATVVGQYVVFTSSATTNFSGDGYTVSGGPLNGVLMMYMPTDGLHYWDASSTSTKIRQVPFTIPSGVTAMRPYKFYMVGLAGKLVYWTDAADPGNIPTTFTAGTGNDAGQITLAETNGMCIECKPLGDANIIYKEDSMYEMQYIGGNSVFNFTRIPGNDGIAGKNCVVDTPVGHVFLTQNLDIKVYNGTGIRSIGDGRVRKWLAAFFNPFVSSLLPNCLSLMVNPEKNEVWVCFPTTGVSGTAPNRALVWNWDSDTWGIFDLGSYIVAGRSGIWPNSISAQQKLVLIGSPGGLGVVDSTNAALLPTSTATLERIGMDVGDRDTLKYIDRSRWNADGAGTLSVYHGASSFSETSPTYPSGPAAVTLGTTDYAGQRGTPGRFVAMKMSTTLQNISIRTVDLDIKAGGKR